MRYTKIDPKAVSRLREKIRITQQELAVRVGCSLSAVQFWEAGRSSPRGYRLRRLVEICPDHESRSLFFANPAEEAATFPEPPKVTSADHGEWKSRYLNPSGRELSRESLARLGRAAMTPLELQQVIKADRYGDPDRPLSPTPTSFLQIHVRTICDAIGYIARACAQPRGQQFSYYGQLRMHAACLLSRFSVKDFLNLDYNVARLPQA